MKDIQFKYIGEAVVLAIGLFLAGGAISKGIVKFKEMDRTVTAKGLSEKEVKANKARRLMDISQIPEMRCRKLIFPPSFPASAFSVPDEAR